MIKPEWGFINRINIIAWQCFYCGSVNSAHNIVCGKCNKDKKIIKQF